MSPDWEQEVGRKLIRVYEGTQRVCGMLQLQSARLKGKKYVTHTKRISESFS